MFRNISAAPRTCYKPVSNRVIRSGHQFYKYLNLNAEELLDHSPSETLMYMCNESTNVTLLDVKGLRPPFSVPNTAMERQIPG